MRNIEQLPTSENVQKDIWRDSLLLDSCNGIELGYEGSNEGVHQFTVNYREGYRGFNYTDEEIESKAKDVLSMLPEMHEIDLGITRK